MGSSIDSEQLSMSDRPRKYRRFSAKTIIPYVCGAVIHLRDVKGSSIHQILNYLKSENIVEDDHLPLIDKALKRAVRCDVLTEHKDGKFRLADGSCQTIEKLIKEHANNFSCCPKRRRPRCKRRRRSVCKKRRMCPKKRTCPRKKRRSCRRGCTKMWVPPRCRRKCKKADQTPPEKTTPTTENVTKFCCDANWICGHSYKDDYNRGASSESTKISDLDCENF